MKVNNNENMGWSVKKSMNFRNVRTEDILQVFSFIDNVEKHLLVLTDYRLFEYFHSHI